MANRAVFIDRDGTMAKDAHYCRRPEDFELFPRTAKAVKLLNSHGFKVIVVTNQSGIARGYFTAETLAQIHGKMKKEMAKEGAFIDAVYYCPHHPDDNCDCRKPKPRLVLQAAREYDIDLSQSFVVGDLLMDVGLGRAVGARTILISQEKSSELMPNHIAADLYQAAEWIVSRR